VAALQVGQPLIRALELPLQLEHLLLFGRDHPKQAVEFKRDFIGGLPGFTALDNLEKAILDSLLEPAADPVEVLLKLSHFLDDELLDPKDLALR
jgi:hypothetical protein